MFISVFIIQILHSFTNIWTFVIIDRNCFLGNRKKKAKFLMRTFTSRSTFLYGRGEVRAESWEGEIGGQGPYKEDGEKKTVELKINNVTRFLTVKNCPLVSIIWVSFILMNCLTACTLWKKILWKKKQLGRLDSDVVRNIRIPQFNYVYFELSQRIYPELRSITEMIYGQVYRKKTVSEMEFRPMQSLLGSQQSTNFNFFVYFIQNLEY